MLHEAIVLCGDVLPRKKVFSDSFCKSIGITFIRCSEDRDQIFSLRRRLNVSFFVVRKSFLEQLVVLDLAQLTNYGKGSSLLAVMESDTVDRASAVRMLRLGCRGVLPCQFSSRVFKKAVLAVSKGEFWAPRAVISELLADLLWASTLKAENGLTPQEARILELTSQGYKTSGIAEVLCISPETVRWHKRRLNRKLRGVSRSPAA